MDFDVEAGRSGLTAEGTGAPPLFSIVATAAGEPPPESELANVEARHRVHRLSLSRSDGSAGRTVQGIAARTIRRLREVQPSGPYRIVGYRECALVAYEVAVQLLGADEAVELLGAIDAAGPLDAGARSPSPGPLERALLDYELAPSPLVLHLAGPSDLLASAATRWGAAVPSSRVRLVPSAGGLAAGSTSLAAALQGPRGDRPIVRERPHAALLPIHGGQAGVSPFFCVPGAGASITDFVHVPGAVGEHHPLLGFQSRGMDGALVPRASVEAAARAYVAELEKACPEGPFHLVGHSFGGWIAFEMALLLRSAGRRLASLTLLDSEPPDAPGVALREYDRVEALMELVALYEQAAERPLGVDPAVLAELPRERQLALLHERLVAAGVLPARIPPAALRGPVRSFESSLRTHYRPARSFDGTLNVVVVPGLRESPEAAERRFARDVEAWGAFAAALRVKRGTGNHVTLLKPPHVADWAGWIPH